MIVESVVGVAVVKVVCVYDAWWGAARVTLAALSFSGCEVAFVSCGYGIGFVDVGYGFWTRWKGKGSTKDGIIPRYC
jgi:hypothetical protein